MPNWFHMLNTLNHTFLGTNLPLSQSLPPEWRFSHFHSHISPVEGDQVVASQNCLCSSTPSPGAAVAELSRVKFWCAPSATSCCASPTPWNPHIHPFPLVPNFVPHRLPSSPKPLMSLCCHPGRGRESPPGHSRFSPFGARKYGILPS